MKLERYEGVHGRANVAKISSAIEECGGRILQAPNPSVAPYEYTIKTPAGERRELVCYAFTANKYRQAGRPSGEHRFQIKYGGEFHRYHNIYIDPKRARTTLMFGVHHEWDLFVAVDPVMHTPTWFSSSVEMKEADLDEAKDKGWHGWERERSAARRKKVMPLESLQNEAVCAFTPNHFLDYVEFERLASALDASERLLVGEEIAKAGVPRKGKRHPLEKELGLSAADLLDVLGGTARLLVAVRGRVAEHHLGKQLEKTSRISDVTPIDADGQPDFSVVYRKKRFRIECKNVGRDARPPRVDFQKTRAAKGNPCSRYYSPDQFEVLAACLHPVTSKWEYQFCPTTSLDPHKTCAGRLSSRVIVDGGAWSSSLTAVLDECARA